MNCVRGCGDFLLKISAALIIKRPVKDNCHLLIKIQKFRH